MKTRDIIKEFISGLAIVLGNFVPLPISVITMIMNVALLILGFLSIGREFGGKTVYTSILLPVIIGILEVIFPNNTSMTADPFLDMLIVMVRRLEEETGVKGLPLQQLTTWGNYDRDPGGV